ncbi:hypothetical protein PUN28_005036 [Cardiocondyla obscurior]|uniref:Ribosomal protein L20 n=1 Tax=Cardiocondyla obscurior TaxID=286306 RepID=A0AAW2GGJ9_9HYME
MLDPLSRENWYRVVHKNIQGLLSIKYVPKAATKAKSRWRYICKRNSARDIVTWYTMRHFVLKKRDPRLSRKYFSRYWHVSLSKVQNYNLKNMHVYVPLILKIAIFFFTKHVAVNKCIESLNGKSILVNISDCGLVFFTSMGEKSTRLK